jgi:hypothetical protein
MILETGRGVHRTGAPIRRRTSYVVRWRLGGSRSGRKERETFGARTDARNKARAEGFREMVAAAGEFWPDAWVKGRVRPRSGG